MPVSDPVRTGAAREDAIHAPLPPAPLPPPVTRPPERQRSFGRIHLRVGAIGGATRVLDLAESGPARLRFPRSRTPEREAILVNTAGGIACGDRCEIRLALNAGADLILTTAAAEKVYRSDGPVSTLLNTVELARAARLAWLPQETILFDHARLRRRFEADLADDAGLLIVELVAFGRAARGERLTEGLFEDHWRVRREGRSTYAESLRLEGPIAELLARPAIGGGAGALGTILDLAPGAEARLDEARARLDAAGAGADGVEAGASAWNGHLAVRLVGPAIGALRGVAARFLAGYRGAPMPRVWQS